MTWRPVVTLLVLSPFVAEYMLGDFSIRQLWLLPFFIPQYGGGALLIRELARRRRGGWPAILLLALAYALVEEGLTTQSLFNPNYAGQRLLDYGYVPWLGTSLVWTTFVLTLHVVWSMSAPIAVAEGLAGDRGRTPWLGMWGLAVTAVVFLLGCVMTAITTQRMFPFVASVPEFTVVSAVVVIVSACALMPRRESDTARAGRPPSATVVALAVFVMTALFQVFYHLALRRGLPPIATLAVMLALEGVMLTALAAWSRRAGWSEWHPLAAATGALATYGCLGVVRLILTHHTALGMPAGTVDLVAQILMAAIVLSMPVSRLRRSRVQP